jgi:hypothetical protein
VPRKPARKAARKRTRSKAGPKAEKHLSLRGLGRSLGVSLTAVQKGIRSGRLTSASIGYTPNGTPYVANPARAVEEWNAGATKADTRQGQTSTLVQAQLGVAEARREGLTIANAQKRGDLVNAAAAQRAAYDCARTIKEAMLNLPDRLAAELAGESDPRKVHARLEEEVRAALEAVAEVLAHGE